MATPRKHWFRVADSILYEGWDDSQIATMVRLGAYLNTRWAREGRTPEEACRARLDPTDLAKITGKRRRDVALKSLQRLANVTGMTAESDGDFVEIIWPKWAIFQELRPPKLPGERPEISPSANAPARHPRKRERGANAPAPEAPSKPTARTKIQKPESFEGEAKERIRKWAAGKGFGPAVLNAGLDRFREWAPLKNPTRTIDQWVSAFMRIVREGFEKGEFSNDPARKPKGAAYADADELLRKRREEYEREVAAEDPGAVGRIIDMALKRDVS